MVVMDTTPVFQYFFAIGSGLATGILTVLGFAWMIYRFVTRKRQIGGME